MMTINKTVTKSVTLGTALYGSPLGITHTGTIDPALAGAIGIEIPSSLATATILNAGHISGGAGGLVSGNAGAGINAFAATSIDNSGTITGGSDATNTHTGEAGGIGIDLRAGGRVTNTGTILGGTSGRDSTAVAADGANGVQLRDVVLNNSGTITGGVDGYSSGDGTIPGSLNVQGGIGADLMDRSAGVNHGTIVGGRAGLGKGSTGIGAGSPGFGSSGGIGIQLANSTFTNAGTITGGYGGSGLAGQHAAPSNDAGANLFSGGALTNTGVITGGEAAYKVVQDGPGQVTFSTNAGDGVVIHGASLSNAGTISGGGAFYNFGPGASSGAGIYIEGGIIKNSGHIIGGAGALCSCGDGIDLVGGVVINTGTISGGSYAERPDLSEGGAGVNISTGTLVAGGTIAGGTGSFLSQGPGAAAQGVGVYINAGTVVASGTITGGYDYATYTQRDAVAFGTLAGTLVIDPGAVFNGQVAAIAGDGDALILAGAKQGTLAGLGTQFTGFDSLTVNAGAHWSLTGTAALAIGLPVQDNGVLTLAEAVTGSGTITIGNNATLNAQQSVAGPTIAFTGPGHLTIGDAKGFTSPITGFGTGDVVDLSHLKATSATFADNTLTLLNGTATVGSLAFAGTFTSSNFSLTADGHGGTNLTFAATPPADFAPLLATIAEPAGAAAEPLALLHAIPTDSLPTNHLDIGARLSHSA
jgi:hypothetical protein